MAEKTAIAWCDHTLNFWEGCTKVSPGCDNCYAAARDARFHAGAHWGPGAPRRERLMKACEEARRLDRKAREAGVRRRVFVNSLADFFDNEVPTEWRPYALGIMRACTHLDFLLLTKRIGNVRAIIEGWDFWPLDNVWLGATVVTQEEAHRDTLKLLDVPARVRFLSIEPQLEEINLSRYLYPIDWAAGHPIHHMGGRDLVDGRRVDWVICGGESSGKARPFNLAWARSLRDQCAAAGVSFFMKQLGAYPLSDRVEVDDDGMYCAHLSPDHPPGVVGLVLKDRAGADPAEWPQDLRIQQFPRSRP